MPHRLVGTHHAVLLFEPLAGLFDGDEVAGLELGLELRQDRGIHTSRSAVERIGDEATEELLLGFIDDKFAHIATGGA